MLNNNNKKIINKIVSRSFWQNKNRNIVTVIAITLTTVLFTAIFTMGGGMMETVQSQNIRKYGGDGHALFNLIDDDIFNKIKQHDLINKIAYSAMVADGIRNADLEKWPVEMWYMDNNSIEFAGYKLKGKMPEAENEIIMDSQTAEVIGIDLKIGNKFTLQYEVKDEAVTKEFILSGYWITDSLSESGRIVVSEEYWNHNKASLLVYDSDTVYYSGNVSAYIMFSNNFHLDEKVDQVVQDLGYQTQDKEAKNYIIARLNPAYQSMNIWDDPSIILSFMVFLLLIIFTGYLIIYNIFQISVIQDIQFYGQIKTIGATSKQINAIIVRSAFLLTCIGIPIGLLIGYFLGGALMPYVLAATSFSADEGTSISPNILILVTSSVLTLITVFISVSKPGKMAGKVSPILALRYTEKEYVKKKSQRKTQKKTKKENIIYKMALSNLGRNKMRTILVILSMSLSLILFNTVFTISQGFDENKYISRFVDTDFLISSSSYFQSKFSIAETDLTDSFIDNVTSQASFKEGGRLYSSKPLKEYFSIDSQEVITQGNFNIDRNGLPMINLYGIEPFLLDLMDVHEGNIDLVKLKSGKYIILGLESDERGRVIENNGISVGDKLTFYRTNEETGEYEKLEYEVLAKAVVKKNSTSDRTVGLTKFYLPAEEFLEIADSAELVSFAFNVELKGIAQMEEYLNHYTGEVETLMDYDSKLKYVDAFKNMTFMFVAVGSSLSIIIGMIGVINFVNSIITSIIARYKEFAILQSIGLTGKQLCKMLCHEGLYYALGTIGFSLVFGIAFSYIIVRGIINSFWAFSYHFIIWPLFLAYPLLIILTIAIPMLAYQSIKKKSIIHRLKEN